MDEVLRFAYPKHHIWKLRSDLNDMNKEIFETLRIECRIEYANAKSQSNY